MSGVIKYGGEIGEPVVISIRPSRHPEEYEDPTVKATLVAEGLVADARRRAETIISTARREVDQIYQQSRLEGYERGSQEGAARSEELVERLEAYLRDAREDRASLMESAEPDLLKLCLIAVEKIVRHEARTDRGVVIRLIKLLMRRVKDGSEVSVRVSPREVEQVRAKRDELLAECEAVRGITISDDRRISPGGCIVETDSGDFDGRMETQLDKIRRKIAELATDGAVSGRGLPETTALAEDGGVSGRGLPETTV